MYCSKCGSNLSNDATFCSRCGAQIGLTPALTPAGAAAPLTAEAPVAVAPPGYIVSGQAVYVQPQVLYAGFWLRVLAYCIDVIVLGVFAVPILIGGAMALGIGGMLASSGTRTGHIPAVLHVRPTKFKIKVLYG